MPNKKPLEEIEEEEYHDDTRYNTPSLYFNKAPAAAITEAPASSMIFKRKKRCKPIKARRRRGCKK